MKKNIDLLHEPILPALTRLALPIMATSLVQMAYNMTDMAWIGRVGACLLYTSPLAERMRRADEEGRLHKEQQFVVGIPAREMDEADSDELVLIQGIIDAWFEDENLSLIHI